MQHHRTCGVFGLSFCLVSIVAGCGYGRSPSWPSYGSTLSEYSGPDGSGPSGLILARDGNFYGTTSSGGQFNQGTVFRITPGGVETVLYAFASGNADGANPTGNFGSG